MTTNFLHALLICCLLCAFSVVSFAQEPTQAPAPPAAIQIAGSTVPRLVSFSGVIKDAAGKPVTGPVSVTFSLFAEQEGGSPLWSEAQIVQADGQGKYAAYLGATDPAGLPLDVFSTGAARWLAIQTPEQPDQPRVLLVGVPYALKAADADTLGGKPPSAFLTTDSQAAQPSGTSAAAAPGAVAAAVTPATTPTGGGTTNYIPLWTSSTNLGNSILFQSGTSTMEVKGTFELPNIHAATTSTGYNSEPLDLYASVYNSSVGEADAQHFRWLAEPVANDTSSASGKLDLLFAPGNIVPAETGLSISSQGILTFASGQTFPGTGPGTIAGVTAGTDLTGGGSSGTVTLNVDTTKVPQLATANSFTGNQSVTGNMSATGLISAGGNITATGSVSGASLGAINGMSAGGNITASGGLSAYQTANSNGAEAVYAYAEGSTANTIGVYASTASSAGSGVYGVQVGPSAEGATAGDTAGLWGDTNQTGGTAVLGTADTGSAGTFYNFSESTPALSAMNGYFNSSIPAWGTVFQASGSSGYCTIDGAGNLRCTGSKSAVVPVDNGSRKVALYAVEAPENWFEDFGSGQLSGGVAHIDLESVFAQTVNTDVEYHVFVTPNDDCKGLYVTSKTAGGFEVHELGGGRSNISFDYRIVAHRKGYETIRLADKTKEFNGSKLSRRNANGASRPLTPKPATTTAPQQ